MCVINRCVVLLLVVGTLLGCGKPTGITPPQDEIIPPPPPPPPPISTPKVSVVVPVGMVPGFEYTWVASWDSGTEPFTIAWEFGGGAVNLATETATSPATASVTIASEPLITYDYVVLVTDADGLGFEATGSYEIGETQTEVPDIVDDDDDGGDDDDDGDDDEPILNLLPTIESVEEDQGTVIVSVSDSDDAVVAVYVTDIPGMHVDPEPKMVAVPGTAVFHFTADQYFASETGTTTITVNDGSGGKDTVQVDVNPHIPEGYVFTAEYDRASRMLTLNRDFTNRELVNLKFSGPEWIQVTGGFNQMVPGEWTTMSIEVELSDNQYNLDDLVISAQAFSRPLDPMPSSPVFEATVNVVRPLFISNIEYDYFEVEYFADIDALEGAELSFDTTYSNGIQGTDIEQDLQNPDRYSVQVDFSSSEIKYGNAGVTVSDQFGNTDTEQVFLQHESVSLVDDRIYAYYDREQAGVGEDVMITVVTGKLSQPFHFMIGAGLVMDPDVEYVPKSFNVGSPGGDKDFPDGIWAVVNPDSFMLMPDSIIQPGANPEDSLGETQRWDFNISPMDGEDINDGIGDLFNILVNYSAPGLKTLTFQEFNGVRRTYYAGWDTQDFFWDDISNWHPGFQTSIVIE